MRSIRRVRRKADAPPESASAKSLARVSFCLHRRSLRRILPDDRPPPGGCPMDAAATMLPFQPTQTIAPLNVGDMDVRVQQRIRRRLQFPRQFSRGFPVAAPALVFPGEAMALPHIGPAVAAAVLARPALEAISRPSGRPRPASGSRRRSMKCSCAAERSFSSDARHLAMNAPGVMPPPTQPCRPRTAGRRFLSSCSRHRPSVSWLDTAPRAGRHSVS